MKELSRKTERMIFAALLLAAALISVSGTKRVADAEITALEESHTQELAALTIQPTIETQKVEHEYIYAPMAADYATIENEEIPQSDLTMMAQCLYGEYRLTATPEQKAQAAAVAWVILNRVDNPRYPNSISEVITAPNQFHGYSAHNPIDKGLYEIAYDVYRRWEFEKFAIGSVGRVLDADVYSFAGNGTTNTFRKADGTVAQVGAENPYAMEAEA